MSIEKKQDDISEVNETDVARLFCQTIMIALGLLPDDKCTVKIAKLVNKADNSNSFGIILDDEKSARKFLVFKCQGSESLATTETVSLVPIDSEYFRTRIGKALASFLEAEDEEDNLEEEDRVSPTIH